jgi:hypothetical protein
LIRLTTGASWVDIEAILEHRVSDTTLRARRDEWIQASTPPQALFWARRATPALVLLDTTIRGARVLLGEFRGEGRLLIALNDDDSERIRALEDGCLDALPKSLEPDELAIRVTRLARLEDLQASGSIVAGPLIVDLSTRRLLWKEEEIPTKTIYSWRYKGIGPPAVPMGKYLRFRAGDIAAWLDTRADPPLSDEERDGPRPRPGRNRAGRAR